MSLTLHSKYPSIVDKNEKVLTKEAIDLSDGNGVKTLINKATEINNQLHKALDDPDFLTSLSTSFDIKTLNPILNFIENLANLFNEKRGELILESDRIRSIASSALSIVSETLDSVFRLRDSSDDLNKAITSLDFMKSIDPQSARPALSTFIDKLVGLLSSAHKLSHLQGTETDDDLVKSGDIYFAFKQSDSHISWPHLRQAVTSFDELGEPIHQGKVRNVYATDKEDEIILGTTDRLSAFDKPAGTIPYKGAMLEGVSRYWFNHPQVKSLMEKHGIKSHILEEISPNTTRVKKLNMIPIEMVVRGNIAGSLWDAYQTDSEIVWREDNDFRLGSGLEKYGELSEPVLTPTEKTQDGDPPISAKQIIEREILSQEQWNKIQAFSNELFVLARKEAASKGLILMDTKFEFGLDKNGAIYLADEILTMDSSRYCKASGFAERVAEGKDPESMDKDLARNDIKAALKNHGHDDPKKYTGKLPDIGNRMRLLTANGYKAAYEGITGQSFRRPN